MFSKCGYGHIIILYECLRVSENFLHDLMSEMVDDSSRVKISNIIWLPHDFLKSHPPPPPSPSPLGALGAADKLMQTYYITIK